MTGQEVTITIRTSSQRLSASEQAILGSIVPEFTDHAPDPNNVELVITDKYGQVAGEFTAQALHQHTESNQGTYSPSKPDGALAVAKTIELPHNRVVVVASNQTFRLGLPVTRRVLLHEAQHVRLIQNGDGAWAVHRRVPITRPDDLVWEFIWLAEIALDEFRCERVMTQGAFGTPVPSMSSLPSDYPGIIKLFETARVDYKTTGDLEITYYAVVQALDRLTTYLAYGAAGVVAKPDALSTWNSVPEMTSLLSGLRTATGADTQMSDDKVAATVMMLAGTLRSCLQNVGFDLYFTSTGERYLQVLR